MITFSNPRREAVIENWPLGGSKRGTCTFKVETTPKKGERISRTTTGKPRYTTYSQLWCVVDGSNGKTYLLSYNGQYGSVSIMSADMQHCATTEELGFDHYVSASSQPERFNEMRNLAVIASQIPA